jgi:hypothetical protein
MSISKDKDNGEGEGGGNTCVDNTALQNDDDQHQQQQQQQQQQHCVPCALCNATYGSCAAPPLVAPLNLQGACWVELQSPL